MFARRWNKHANVRDGQRRSRAALSMHPAAD